MNKIDFVTTIKTIQPLKATLNILTLATIFVDLDMKKSMCLIYVINVIG